jgi:hypothetical protein
VTTARTAKAARNLLPYSLAPLLADALREWAYTGQSNDYGQPEETCQLCDQEDLRYHFEIGNAQTGHHLWVGSKCIQRFEIAGFDHVKVDLARLIREAEERRVRELLVTVAERTEGRVSLLGAWAQRGGLSPSEALRLAKACYRLGIEPGAFPKVRRQRARDRAEWARMSAWERERLEEWIGKS